METVEEINRKLDLLIKRVESLERAVEMERSPIFSATLKTIKFETKFAESLLKGYATMDEYRRLTKDDISLAILRVLEERGILNILQLTEEVKRLRGKSSRRIIRKKLERLAEKNLVMESEKGRGRGFSLKETD